MNSILKYCGRCNKDKPLDSFYKLKNGRYHSWCKPCNANYARSKKGKESHRRYERSEKGKKATARKNSSTAAVMRQRKSINRYPNRKLARGCIQKAIMRGDLPRARDCRCSDCGKPAKEYHHKSYKREHWLDVIPLCRSCHYKADIAIGLRQNHQ